MRFGPHGIGPPGDAAAVAGVSLSRVTMRRIWTFARPYRKLLSIYILAILVAALLALAPPLIVRSIIDTAIPDGNRGLITWLAVLGVAAAIADAGLNVVQRWCSAYIGESLIYDLRSTLFAKVQRMPIAFFTRTPTGAITSRLNNDVVGAQTAVTNTIGNVVSNVIGLVTSLVAMLLLEWRLTALSLVVLPLFVIPARRVGRRLQSISREQMGHSASMNTQMTERFNVSGALLVKLFGNDRREISSFQRHAGGVRDTGVRAALYGRVFFVALGLVAAVGAVAIYGIGAHLVVSGSISTGTLVALATLVTRVYMPLTALTNARVDLMTSMVNFERVFEVLDAPEPIIERPGAIDLVEPPGLGGAQNAPGLGGAQNGRRVTFDAVSFRYPPADQTSVPSLEQRAPETDPDRDVLNGIVLDIAPGETIAIVGASGAGKSTLVSLIPRLYDVTAGAVRVDGNDVRDLTLTSLHRAIGVVSQDPHLFHVSIGENLRYAKPEASDEEVVEAAHRARIHETIAGLADGYDTVVGERGYRLSGGEKQRIAIARLLLKDPAVMILDEATSHLDNDNEAHVQAALDHALHGRTAIVIAHRLSTIRNADRIAVLDGGRIAELGTHEELVAHGGLYAAQLRAGGLFEVFDESLRSPATPAASDRSSAGASSLAAVD